MLATIYLIGLIATPVLAGAWYGWFGDDEEDPTPSDIVLGCLFWPIGLAFFVAGMIAYTIKTALGRS